MTDRPKLTRGQRGLLQLAAQQPDGNPWPKIGVRQRAGGAMHRMSMALAKAGLLDRQGCTITAAGRAAIAAKPAP